MLELPSVGGILNKRLISDLARANASSTRFPMYYALSYCGLSCAIVGHYEWYEEITTTALYCERDADTIVIDLDIATPYICSMSVWYYLRLSGLMHYLLHFVKSRTHKFRRFSSIILGQKIIESIDIIRTFT